MSRLSRAEHWNTPAGLRALRELARPFGVIVRESSAGRVLRRSVDEASYLFRVDQLDIGHAEVSLDESLLEDAAPGAMLDLLANQLRMASRRIRGHLLAQWLRDGAVGAPIIATVDDAERADVAHSLTSTLLKFCDGEHAERVAVQLLERVESIRK